MGNITNSPDWQDVPLNMTTDRAFGAIDGTSQNAKEATIMNRQAAALVKRTESLRISRVSAANNCILYGDQSAGVPTYGSFSGQVFTVDGTTVPVEACFADGRGAFGAILEDSVDYNYGGRSDFWLIFLCYDSGNWEIQTTDVITSGSRIQKYHVGFTAPSIINDDQWWYSTSDRTMYKELGGAWEKVYAIFLGGAKVTSGLESFAPVPFGFDSCDESSPIGMIAPWHSGVAAPKGWHLCDGSTVFIHTAVSLFNVLGSTYGGSGATFVLPTVSNSIIKMY